MLIIGRKNHCDDFGCDGFINKNYVKKTRIGQNYDVNIIGWKVFRKVFIIPTVIFAMQSRLMLLTIWNLVSFYCNYDHFVRNLEY